MVVDCSKLENLITYALYCLVRGTYSQHFVEFIGL